VLWWWFKSSQSDLKFEDTVGAPVKPTYVNEFDDCVRTDWHKSVREDSPAEIITSGLFDVGRSLDFKLALPSVSESWVSQLMKTSATVEHGGMWAPIESVIFLHILNLPAVIEASKVVVDVGVNVGYFSQLALSLGYNVVGFEPLTRAQPYLVKTAQLNANGGAWHLFHCALGAERGKVSMSLTERWGLSQVVNVKRPPPPSEDHSAHEDPGKALGSEIPMVLLSDIVLAGTPVALLKVDVEGFEANVLGGAKELLKGVRNVIVEIKSTDDRRALLKNMKELGFHCRNYQETYVVEEKGSTIPDNAKVGVFLDTRTPDRESLTIKLNKFLFPCTEYGPEDFWFSKNGADFPAHGSFAPP